MSEPSTPPQGAKLSKVEALKETSRRLRGTLAEGLANDAPTFADSDEALLKFHGMYAGYDRDSATERKQQGLDKLWQLMVRARIPGGRLTAAQYLALDDIAGRHADGTIRITTRQAIQYHGVLKGNVKALVQGINHALLSTIAACGDVVRNVMTTPAPIKDAVHRRLEADAALLSDALKPRSRAYVEIWLDGEKLPDSGLEEEPLYGATYLPRKFKIALGTPEDNSADVLTNDLGIIALFEDDRLLGYNLAIGGGLGRTHNKPNTYPRLGTPVCFIGPDELVAGAEAVVRLHRDHGDRADRRHARLKYVVAEKGAAWCKARLEDYLGHGLEDARPMPAFQVKDHTGWHAQGDGNWYLGIPVPNGRIGDDIAYNDEHDRGKLRTALRTLVERYRLGVVLMPSQDIVLADIPASLKSTVTGILRRHGVRLARNMLPVQRWAMACPALPTCGLALTEAERVRAPLVNAVADALSRHGLGQERISIRITGCPNGCARPYAGDIGLVGRMPGVYQLYVGGDFAGTRLNSLLLDRVEEARVAETLEPLFAEFAARRQSGEGFGDFCHRIGLDRLKAVLSEPALAAD